jgi:plastocyanin
LKGKRWASLVAAALAAFCATGCGSSVTRVTRVASSEDESLLDDEARDSVPAVSITASGVKPQVLHLDAPVTVTFTNNDSVAHRFESAPELNYGDCPEMNQLGTLQSGEVGTVVLSKGGGFICTYHEAAGPTDLAFKGALVIH